jgi:hypothetical protein
MRLNNSIGMRKRATKKGVGPTYAYSELKSNHLCIKYVFNYNLPGTSAKAGI